MYVHFTANVFAYVNNCAQYTKRIQRKVRTIDLDFAGKQGWQNWRMRNSDTSTRDLENAYQLFPRNFNVANSSQCTHPSDLSYLQHVGSVL